MACEAATAGEQPVPEPESKGRVPRSLSVATGVGALGLAAGGTAGPLLGSELLDGTAGAGLPVGMVIAGSATLAVPLARRTRRTGRLKALALGYAFGAAGAVLVTAAALLGNVAALLAGSFALGAGNTAIFLTRYAAPETVEPSSRAGAVGTVLFATAAGAIAGPLLLGHLQTLKRAGLVTSKRVGQWTFYKRDEDAITCAKQLLHSRCRFERLVQSPSCA